MKTLWRSLLTAGVAVLLVLTVVTPARAQCGDGVCTPPETTTIVMSDGSELAVSYYFSNTTSVSMNTATIFGDGFCVSITYAPEDMDDVTFTINNSDNPWAWGKGVITLEHMYSSWETHEEVVDLRVLPPEYWELWATLQTTCRQVLDSGEFWELFEGQDKEVIALLRERTELMRDGYLAPSAYTQLVSLQFSVSHWGYEENETSRSYNLDGPVDLHVATRNAWGDESPEIHLSVSSQRPNEGWNIRIDPDREVCEIWLDNVEAVQQLVEDDWRPWIEEFRVGLEFYRDQVPSLIEAGFIEPGGDFQTLIDKSLEGINTYPFELVYPYEWSDVIL